MITRTNAKSMDLGDMPTTTTSTVTVITTIASTPILTSIRDWSQNHPPPGLQTEGQSVSMNASITVIAEEPAGRYFFPTDYRRVYSAAKFPLGYRHSLFSYARTDGSSDSVSVPNLLQTLVTSTAVLNEGRCKVRL